MVEIVVTIICLTGFLVVVGFTIKRLTSISSDKGEQEKTKEKRKPSFSFSKTGLLITIVTVVLIVGFTGTASILTGIGFWDLAPDPRIIFAALFIGSIFPLNMLMGKVAWKPLKFFAVFFACVLLFSVWREYCWPRIVSDLDPGADKFSSQAIPVRSNPKEVSEVFTVKLYPGKVTERFFGGADGHQWQAWWNYDKYNVEFQQAGGPWRPLFGQWNTIDLNRPIRLRSDTQCEIDFKFY